MQPIKRYLETGEAPDDKKEAKKLKLRSAKFSLIEGVLYRRGYTIPLMRCLAQEEADYVLREIHAGICGSHAGGQSITFKALRQGFYWPTMHHDGVKVARKFE